MIEENCVIGCEGPVMRWERTFFNQSGLAIKEPLLKIQINDGEKFWLDTTTLRYMYNFLKYGHNGEVTYAEEKKE